MSNVIIPAEHRAAPVGNYVVQRSNSLDFHVVQGKPSAAELSLLRQVVGTLHKHYGGYVWDVHVNQGVIKVLNKSLSGKWGYVLKSTDFATASELQRAVIIAGGEVLERFHLQAGKRNNDKVRELKKDFVGNKIFDKD